VSLIEEALRKQREENEKSGGPPPLPSPLTDAPSGPPASEELPRRPWALLAGIVGGGVLAILFIIWLLVYGLGLWTGKTANSAIKGFVSTNSAVSVSLLLAHTNDAAKTVINPPRQSNSVPVAGTSIPPPPLKSALPSAQPPPTQPLPEPQSTQVLPIQDKTTPVKAISTSAPPAKLVMPVVWPKLTVSGIIGSTKSGRSAVILNGQMLSPGETIEGITIELIEKQKVKLKYSGEVKILAVGATTE